MKIAATPNARFFTFALCLALLSSLIGISQAQMILFTRDFPSDHEQTSGIAVDATGVYVVGQPGYLGPGLTAVPPFIRKTDFTGAELWTRRLGSSPLSGWTYGVAVSATGVYVVGSVDQAPPNSQLSIAFLRKFDVNGNELWSRQLAASNRDRMLGVAADRAGVYVVGEANSLPGTGSAAGGIFVRRYDGNGLELWTRQDQTGYTGAGIIAADTTGVYVGGYRARTQPSSPRGESLWKYDNTGKMLWTRVLSSGDNERLGTLAADNTGVYFAQGGSGGSLTKFDTAGNELWKRSFETHSRSTNVAVDETGVYVVGVVDSEATLPGQCRAGYVDAFARKYDLAGNPLWVRQFGTAASDSATGVAADATGVWLAGFRQLPGDRSSSFLTKMQKTTPVVTLSMPQITAECVVNAASYVGGSVAPGEIVTIFGSAMGPGELTKMRLTEEGRIATVLAETRILFNGMPAPLLYVSQTQSSAIVPYAVAGLASVDVQVEYKGVRSSIVSAPVAATRAGIFTMDGSGRGQAAVLNEDGSVNSADNPAKRGSVIVLYATGEGLTHPVAVDDQIVGGILPKPRLPVFVSMAYADYADTGATDYVEVLYAGAVSKSVPGLLQVNVRVPGTAFAGTAVPLGLSVGFVFAQRDVTVAVQ